MAPNKHPHRWGEDNPNAKLTQWEANLIRKQYEETSLSYSALAEIYGVSKSTISQIVQGFTWPDTD